VTANDLVIEILIERLLDGGEKILLRYRGRRLGRARRGVRQYTAAVELSSAPPPSSAHPLPATHREVLKEPSPENIDFLLGLDSSPTVRIAHSPRVYAGSPIAPG
jgi:hypothetical protein